MRTLNTLSGHFLRTCRRLFVNNWTIFALLIIDKASPVHKSSITPKSESDKACCVLCSTGGHSGSYSAFKLLNFLFFGDKHPFFELFRDRQSIFLSIYVTENQRNESLHVREKYTYRTSKFIKKNGASR